MPLMYLSNELYKRGPNTDIAFSFLECAWFLLVGDTHVSHVLGWYGFLFVSSISNFNYIKYSNIKVKSGCFTHHFAQIAELSFSVILIYHLICRLPFLFPVFF